MKKFVLCFIIAVMVIVFSGCGADEIPEEIVGNLVTETTEPTEEITEEKPEEELPEETENEEEPAAKITFRLGNSEEKKEIGTGDSIGGWVLEQLETELDTSKEEEFYDSITATFSGEERLKGYISHHPYANAGYIFTINDFDDMNKIPTVEENFNYYKQQFAINVTQIKDFPDIGDSEYFPCYITIDKFYVFRSYTEGMDRANVIKIEIPEKDTGLPKLYEDIIVNFGAKVNDFGELRVGKGVSLYYDREGCIFGKESADVFYSWLMARTPVEDRIKVLFPGYVEEMYALDAEYYEAEVYKYFGISSEQLRKSDCYYPEQNCYFVDYGGGIGETPALIINSIEESEDTVVFHVTVDYDFADEDYNMALTVKLLPDGGYNYVSYLPE